MLVYSSLNVYLTTQTLCFLIRFLKENWSHHCSPHSGGVHDVSVDVRAPQNVVKRRKASAVLHRVVRRRVVVAVFVQLCRVVVQRHHRRIHLKLFVFHFFAIVTKSLTSSVYYRVLKCFCFCLDVNDDHGLLSFPRHFEVR